MTDFTRRSAFQTALGTGLAAGAGLLATGTSKAMAAPGGLDLSSPSEVLKTRVKIIGSTATEPVYTFMRLNVYADPHNGNFVPLFTMNNLLIDRWEPAGDDTYVMTKFEAGYYTEFGSDTPIETMENPFTGETVEIFNFQLGPVVREYTPTEVVAMAYAPDFLPIEVIGDRVFVASQSMEKGPSYFPAEEYPIEAADGDTSYLNSFMTWSAPLAEVTDPEVASTSAHVQIQNKVPWAPWMRMRGRPGGTVLRGFGAKIDGLDALDDSVRAGFEKYVPAILQDGQWDELVFETSDYMRHLEERKAKTAD